MKNIFMITASVAALLAAGGLASAQGMNDHHERPAEAAPEQKAPAGKTDRQHLNAPQKSEALSPAPTAQAPDKPTGARPEAVVHGGGPQPSQHDVQNQNEHTPPHEAARAEPKPGAPAALSAEHHALFRETIRSEKIVPLNEVRFSIKIGEAIPPTVHLNRMPLQILEYAPQYRDYEYILVGDDILVVDPRTLRIVAVIAA